MIPQRAVVWLVVGALVLPVALCILAALAGLLYAMHDQAGALCVLRACVGLFALWIMNLIALIVIQAINSLGRPPRGEDRDG